MTTVSDIPLRPLRLIRPKAPKLLPFEELAKTHHSEVCDRGYPGWFLAAYLHWLWDFLHGWHHPGAPRRPIISALTPPPSLAPTPFPSAHWAAPGWRPPALASPLLS